MIEDLIIMAVMMCNLGVAFMIALVAVLVTDNVMKKKHRAKRKAEHQAQGDADMAEMQKVYYEVLFNEIMKGN